MSQGARDVPKEPGISQRSHQSCSKEPGMSQRTRNVPKDQECFKKPGMSQAARNIPKDQECPKRARDIPKDQKCPKRPGMSQRTRNVPKDQGYPKGPRASQASRYLKKCDYCGQQISRANWLLRQKRCLKKWLSFRWKPSGCPGCWRKLIGKLKAEAK